MRKRFVADSVVAALVATAWLGASLPVRAQTGSQKSTSSIRRAPDGQPDMRGIWVKAGGNIDEANPPKARYTDECREVFGIKAEPTGFNNVEPRPKPQHEPPPRPRGIVDPADKMLPWRAEAAAARLDHVAKMGPPPYSLEHIEMTARCAAPGPWQGGVIQILQRPGAVVMLYENDHGSRVIHLDGRPHLGPAFRSFMGDSIGRWDGNTLVVDTTNLNGKGSFGRLIPYYSDAMHTVERFTVAAPDRIDYEIVYDDPKLFARPIKSVGYFFPANDGYELREETCVEGSYTLKNIFGF